MKEITQDHLIPFKDKEDDLAHYYCLYYLINILRINPIQRWASQKKLSEINIDDIINMIPDGNKRFIQNLKTTSIKYNFPILKEKISYIQDEDTCAFFYFYIMLHYRENNISDIESSATNTLERQHAIFRYFLYSKYISDEKNFK